MKQSNEKLTFVENVSMKKFLISLVVFLISSTVFAQSDLNWTTLNTATSKKINAIYFHDPDTGYIVGDDYLFKKTTDGGMTWIDLTAPTIAEKPGNNGRIVDVEYYNTPEIGVLSKGLYLIWENGYHGVSTDDDGLSYNRFSYSDSNQFCKTTGFAAFPANQGSGYINSFIYGENCNGDAEYFNYFDGPFSVARTNIFVTPTNASYTTVAADSFSNIFGHSDGYLLKFRSPFLPLDTMFLDSSGVAAIAYAGNHRWYAFTNRNFNNMYVSIDSGKTFTIDRSYHLFLNPKVKEFSFLENGIGIAAATNNLTSGAILIQKDSSWDFDIAAQPLNAAQVLDDGTAYVAGDSGLVMKTRILTALNEVNYTLYQWQVYPNPAKELIYLDGLENIAIESIQLLDIHGRLIKSFSSQQTQMDVSDLAKGTYILKVITEGKQQFAKKVLLR